MSKTKIPQIVDVMPDGIFSKMEALHFELPWLESNILLDMDYIYRWSGYKSISPLVAHLLGNKSELSDSDYEKLASIIWVHYANAWTCKFNALQEEYNPLENYNMVEKEDNEIVDDALTNVSGSAANNSTSTSNTHNVYGYNSSSATPSDSDSGSVSQSTDLDTNYDNTRTIDRTLTRSGNIGVTTSQQMLESELKLRAYRFFEEVYKDVDRITALPIYDGEITGAIYSGGSGGGGVSVTSVNGKTGAVTLYGSDIDLTSLISTSVAQAIETLNTDKRNKPTVLSHTINPPDTVFDFIDNSIGDNSNIFILFNRSDAVLKSWYQSGHTLEIEIKPNQNPVKVTVEVYNG